MSAPTVKSDVLINTDMGEAFGLHSFGNDEALMPLIDMANVACGFHSGDPSTMDATVALAKEHDVHVGAHPGLPDLVGFGRREMKVTPDEVESMVRYQVGALCGFLSKHGMPLNHIKPHGSLGGMCARDEDLMLAVVKVAKEYGASILGYPGSAHQWVPEREGVEFIGELYVDLNYDAEGQLIILRRPEKTDPARASARIRRALQDGKVEVEGGGFIDIPFKTICVHSDTPNSPDVARAVRDTLAALPA